MPNLKKLLEKFYVAYFFYLIIWQANDNAQVREDVGRYILHTTGLWVCYTACVRTTVWHSAIYIRCTTNDVYNNLRKNKLRNELPNEGKPVYLCIIKDWIEYFCIEAKNKYCKMFHPHEEVYVLQMWSHMISCLDFVLKASRWCSKRLFQKT